MLTRRKLLGKQLAGAKAFAANPDECRHSVRIFHRVWKMRARVCQRGVGNRELPPGPALPCPNLRRSVSDLPGLKRSRGGGSDLPSASSIHSSKPGPPFTL